MPKLTIVRKKEGFVRPLWICTFCTAEGKEQMVAISLKELCQMITHRKKGEVA